MDQLDLLAEMAEMARQVLWVLLEGMAKMEPKDPQAYQAQKALQAVCFPINSVAGLEKGHGKILIYPRRRKKASRSPPIQTTGNDGNRIGKRSKAPMTQVQRAIQTIIDAEGQSVPARNRNTETMTNDLDDERGRKLTVGTTPTPTRHRRRLHLRIRIAWTIFRIASTFTTVLRTRKITRALKREAIREGRKRTNHTPKLLSDIQDRTRHHDRHLRSEPHFQVRKHLTPLLSYSNPWPPANKPPEHGEGASRSVILT